MDKTRRKLLKAKAALAASAATGISLTNTEQALAQTNQEPLQPISLTGIHGYAQTRITAGESLELRISSDRSYDLGIYRLQSLDEPDETIDELIGPVISGTSFQQDIRPGSYINVVNNLTDITMSEISIECWIRPRDESRWQGIISQHNYPNNCGLGLFLKPGGGLFFYVGNGGSYSSAFALIVNNVIPVTTDPKKKTWYHLVATWSKSTGLQELFLDGELVASKQNFVNFQPGTAPLRIGAYGVESNGNKYTNYTFHGDMAMPIIYGKTLTLSEIQQRAAQIVPSIPNSNNLLAAWPLDEENGEIVHDASGQLRTGAITNKATWMIGGPGFDASAIPRYGYNPVADTNRGHGLRFAIDDLYDCKWQVTHTLPIPVNAKSGIYAARLSSVNQEGEVEHDNITFVVKRPSDRPKSPILVLTATNTWFAYNTTPFKAYTYNNGGDPTPRVRIPLHSQYKIHHKGLPTNKSGLKVPCPAADPYATFRNTSSGGSYSHLVRAERYTHQWLENRGYEFDVATDFDMDSDPALLSGYKVVMILGHSEYWSKSAREKLDNYLNEGGNALVMSGNTMFWRVSLDLDDGVMECRKFGIGGGFNSANAHGEVWHSMDGDQGGLLRDLELPCWKVLGLESAGFNSKGQDEPNHDNTFFSFSVTDPTHSIYKLPNDTDFQQGQNYGEAGGQSLPRAVGHEWDVRVSELQEFSPAPDGMQRVIDPPTIETLAESIPPTKFRAFPYFQSDTTEDSVTGAVASQVIYWQRPQGGKVFNAGSIACGWALSSDPKFGVVIDNVLDDFGVNIQSTPGSDYIVCDALSESEIHIVTVESGTKRIRNKLKYNSTWLPGMLVTDELGGESNFPPAITVNSTLANPRINTFILRTDGTLGNKWSYGSGWVPTNEVWSNLGGNLTGPPSAINWGNNTLDVFAPGIQGDIQFKRWNGTNWSNWSSLGGQAHNLQGPVATLSWTPNLLGVAALGGNGHVYYKFNDSAQWKPNLDGDWIDMGSGFQGEVSLVSKFDSEVHIFAYGTDNKYYHKWWDSESGWQPSINQWNSLDGAFSASPLAINSDTGRINLLGVGLDGVVYNKWLINGQWNPAWENMGSGFEGKLSAVSRPGDNLDIFAIDTDKIINTKLWNGSSWIPSRTGWTKITT